MYSAFGGGEKGKAALSPQKKGGLVRNFPISGSGKRGEKLGFPPATWQETPSRKGGEKESASVLSYRNWGKVHEKQGGVRNSCAIKRQGIAVASLCVTMTEKDEEGSPFVMQRNGAL